MSGHSLCPRCSAGHQEIDMKSLRSIFWLPGVCPWSMTKWPQVFSSCCSFAVRESSSQTSCTLLTGWFQSDSICSKVETFISYIPLLTSWISLEDLPLSARWRRSEAVGACSQEVHTVAQLSSVTGRLSKPCAAVRALGSSTWDASTTRYFKGHQAPSFPKWISTEII